MRSSKLPALWIASAVIACQMLPAAMAAPPAASPRKSKIEISRETTHYLGPIDAEGYIDYIAAFDEHCRRGVTPADNALVEFWQAIGPREFGSPPSAEYFRALGIKPPSADERRFLHEDDYCSALDPMLSEITFKQFEEAKSRIWTAREFPVVYELLRLNDEALTRAVAATKRSQYYRPIVRRENDATFIGALLPNESSMLRECAAQLALRAHLRMGEGRSSEAWTDLIAVRRLSRLMGRTPVLLDQLSAGTAADFAATAEQSFLAANRLNAAELRLCLSEFKGLPATGSWAEAIDRGERSLRLDWAQRIARGDYSSFESELDDASFKVKKITLTDEHRATLAANDFAAGMRRLNREIDRHVAALRLEDPALRHAEIERLKSEAAALGEKFKQREAEEEHDVDRIRAGELFDFALGEDSLFDIWHDPLTSQEQKLELTKIGLALAAYRAERGRFPPTLDELRPDYFKTVPTDLFTGKPLVYRLDGDGYLLYGAGPNLRDDAGENNLREEERDEPTDDIALRITQSKP